MGENICLLFENIDNAEDENKPGVIFFSDFEKKLSIALIAHVLLVV